MEEKQTCTENSDDVFVNLKIKQTRQPVTTGILRLPLSVKKGFKTMEKSFSQKNTLSP